MSPKLRLVFRVIYTMSILSHIITFLFNLANILAAKIGKSFAKPNIYFHVRKNALTKRFSQVFIIGEVDK